MVLAYRHLLSVQWWIFPSYIALNAPVFFVPSWWWFIGATGALFVYLLFWLIQFYGLSYLEQFKMYFEPMHYEISSKEITMKVSSKHGMPVSWSMIRRAFIKKNSFVLYLNKVQLIYLPFKAFRSPHEVKFVETILKRKHYV